MKPVLRRDFLFSLLSMMGLGTLVGKSDLLERFVEKSGGSETLFVVRRTIELPQNFQIESTSGKNIVNSDLLPEVPAEWFQNHTQLLQNASKEGRLLWRQSDVRAEKNQMSWTLIWENREVYEQFFRAADIQSILKAFQIHGIKVKLDTVTMPSHQALELTGNSDLIFKNMFAEFQV